MNPITSKIAEQALSSGGQSALAEGGKFDRMLAAKQNELSTIADSMQNVTAVSEQQKAALTTQLRIKIEQQGTTNPQQLFSAEMQGLHRQMGRAVHGVSALPKTSAFDGLRNHLQNLESQYRNTGSLMKTLGPDAKLQDLLSLQQDMYLMNENLEIFSKVVEQTSGGVKTILQTQV